MLNEILNLIGAGFLATTVRQLLQDIITKLLGVVLTYYDLDAKEVAQVSAITMLLERQSSSALI